MNKVLDLMWKIRSLFGFVRSGYESWKREVWERDPDERFCCDGKMCACRGSTVREVYTP